MSVTMCDPYCPVSLRGIGRRINCLGRNYDAVAEAQAGLSEDSELYSTAHNKLVVLLDEQAALRDLALAMQPKTLADAAVQLGVLFEMLTEMYIPNANTQQSDELARELARFERAVASITLVVAEAARVTPDEIGDPCLSAKLQQHRATVNLPPDLEQ